MESSPNSEASSLGQRLLNTILLPDQVSAFEATYLKRMNRIALWFFAAHLPVFMGIAALNGTGVLSVAVLTAAVLGVPFLAARAIVSERKKTYVHAFTAMSMGAVLVHAGQGPVQIEMHFYFFSILAMLALFANPMTILVGAATVAVQHLGLWFLVPASVFNYDAPLWVVLVHAAFVVLETFAACFIARNFFDNVIGLEKKVQARTQELESRNKDMQSVLDNVRQGLVSLGAESEMSSEHSQALIELLGEYEPGEKFGDYLARSCPKTGTWFEMNFEALSEGFLPVELALDQLPASAQAGDRHLEFEYEPEFDESEVLIKMLVIVSDRTVEFERERSESRQRETLRAFEHIMRDKRGFLDFYREAGSLVESASESFQDDPGRTKRAIHTLKGNSGSFGLSSLSEYCHALEDSLAEGSPEQSESAFGQLIERWKELSATVDQLVGHETKDSITVEAEEYDELLQMVIQEASYEDLALALAQLQMEPTAIRLERLANQAKQVAEYLERGVLELEVEDGGVRVERERFAELWSSLTHVVRNAIDHGLEAPEERTAAGKPESGRLCLRTYEEGAHFVIEIADDGRGIDWEGVSKLAESRGLQASSREDLVEALLTPSFTTRESVTAMSGRGVGLAAVQEAVAGLGGSITIESEVGDGTVTRIRLPRAQPVESLVA